MNALVVFTVVLLFALSGCAVRQDDAVDRVSALVTKSETPPTEGGPPPVSQLNARPLTRRQKRRLDASLPAKVREVLRKAESLEVFGISPAGKAGIGWYPDLKTVLPRGQERDELLNAFFFDASAGPNPSACFIPRHSLKATYAGKTVEVIICYQCHLFVVEGDLGKFDGGFYKEGSAAHQLFESIVRKGAPITEMPVVPRVEIQPNSFEER